MRQPKTMPENLVAFISITRSGASIQISDDATGYWEQITVLDASRAMARFDEVCKGYTIVLEQTAQVGKESQIQRTLKKIS